MTELKDVDKAQVDSALKTILDDAQKQTSLGVGSEDAIRDMIVGAFGESQGSTVADRVLISSQSDVYAKPSWGTTVLYRYHVLVTQVSGG